MNRFILRFAARESSGAFSPGRYLPVSTPWASGDHTICVIPFASQTGITSASGLRHSAEYCGVEETNFATPGSFSAASIFSAGHSLNPMKRALPASTTSVSAPIVSSSGDRVVVAVALIEVDVVGVQPLQRRVDLLEDLRAREPSVARAHREEHLRREHVGVARIVAEDLAPDAARPRPARTRSRCRTA